MQNPKFEIFTGSNSQYYFRLKATNGEIILNTPIADFILNIFKDLIAHPIDTSCQKLTPSIDSLLAWQIMI